MCLYAQMQLSSVRPNEYVYVAVLKACAVAAALQTGKEIHSDIVNTGYDSNLYVGTALIDMYSRCGRADDAVDVFKKLPDPDIVCWNALISGLAQNGFGEQAFQVFIKMRKAGAKPNHVTFVSILKACAETRNAFQGRLIHSQITVSGFDANVFVGSALIDMYAKCGNVEEAAKVFQNLPEKNLVTWNAMIAGYAENGCGRSALRLFDQMQKGHIRPDSFTFVSALQACGSLLALDDGKKIHFEIAELGLEVDAFLGSALIDMYNKCGNLLDAQKVFDSLHKKSVVLWNSIIAAYVQHGHFEQAVALFEAMRQGGVVPNKATFASTLRACSSIPALEQGKLIHTQVIQCGLEVDLCIGSALVDMYAKGDSLHEALQVFDKMPDRDVVTWNALITGVVQHGFDRKALELFTSMQTQGVEPDKITIVTVLKACGRLVSVDDGKVIHSCILSHRLELDEVICSNLIDMYVKCGNLEMACRLFDGLPKRNVLAWNAMIKAYAMHGQSQLSLKCFSKMQMEGTKCDSVTYVSVLKICGSIGTIEAGEQIHELIIQDGYASDLFVGNSLIDMYVKCGCLEKATDTFDGLTGKDVVSWSIMIAGYVQQEMYQNALNLFDRMQEEGIEPDDVTYVSILRCCGSTVAIDQGKQVHKCLLAKGLSLDSFVGNALVDMYAKCESLTEARKAFNELSVRNVQSWNALLSGYAHHGLGQSAIHHFQIMQHEGTEPDDVTLLSILSACSHSNLLDEGFHIFHSVSEGIKNLISKYHYACMVDLLSRAGNLHDAENLISKLQLPFKAIS